MSKSARLRRDKASAQASAPPTGPQDGQPGEDGRDAAEQDASPLEQARAEARRLTSRYAAQLTPIAIIGGTDLVGIAADAATGAGPLAALAAGAGAASGLIHAARRRTGRWGRTYAAIACTASMSWATAAAALGSGGIMQTLLWLGGAAMALPWWVRHSEATPDVTAELATREPAPAPAPEPAEEPPAPDWRAVRWSAHLACKDGPHTGSRLLNVKDIAYGWQATVDLPIRHHWSEVVAAAPQIASVYGLPDGRVVAESVPGAPVHRARVTVLMDSPLENITHWRGPGLDVATGTFPVAVAADGQMLPWRLWQPGAGMTHGLIAGTTGSGKSAAMDLVLSEIANSDRLMPVIIDGSGGASVPDWLEHVPYKATDPDGAIDLLTRLVAAMQARFNLLTRIEWTDKHGRRRTGRNSIDPTPEIPGIVIVIDEAHELLMHELYGKRIRRLLERLLQMGRKVCVGGVLATQQPSVSQLGGSSVIRDMLRSGNVLALRTGERVSGGMIAAGLPEPLERLPQYWPDGSPTQGLGYVTTQRAIRSRTLLVDDPYAQATSICTRAVDPATTAALTAPAGRGTGRRGPAASPAMHVTTDMTAQHADAGTDEDVVATVRRALDAGVDADAFALARHTGLGWRAAKQALRDLN